MALYFYISNESQDFFITKIYPSLIPLVPRLFLISSCSWHWVHRLLKVCFTLDLEIIYCKSRFAVFYLKQYKSVVSHQYENVLCRLNLVFKETFFYLTMEICCPFVFDLSVSLLFILDSHLFLHFCWIVSIHFLDKIVVPLIIWSLITSSARWSSISFPPIERFWWNPNKHYILVKSFVYTHKITLL